VTRLAGNLHSSDGARPERLRRVNAFFETCLAPLLTTWHLTALDVGARSGFTDDLASIAACVDAVGFEPDAEECLRLNAAAEAEPVPWRSLRYLNTGIGAAAGEATLRTCARPGCSSILEPDIELAQRFCRADYYAPTGEITLRLEALDTLAELYRIEDARHLKMDVQGYEHAVIAGAGRLLAEQVVSVRSEVSFLPLYKGQALFRDVDAELAKFGFAPMFFLESHEWRRTTKRKLPRLADGPLPWSRGQLIHGDVLFLKSPETIASHHPRPDKALVDLGLIALCFGCIDHAMAAFSMPEAARLIDVSGRVDMHAACAEISQLLAADEGSGDSIAAAQQKTKEPVWRMRRFRP
jgi:FkbM family methyltransferase